MKHPLSRALFLFSLCLSLPLFANEDNAFQAPYARNPQEPAAEIEASPAVQAQVALSQRQVSEKAGAALMESRGALESLQEGRQDDARESLERALADLESIHASNPGEVLAPAEVETTDIEFNGGGSGEEVREVVQAAQQARDLLSNGRPREARRLLDSLRSETVVNVENIPLSTFPAALRDVARLLGAGDNQAAEDSLEAALDSLVETGTVVPHPLAQAQEMLEKARQLAGKSGAGAKDKTGMGGLLDGAKAQLKLAQAYGYGDPKDFEDLFAQIDSARSASGGQADQAFAQMESLLSQMLKAAWAP